ncbi:MAG: SDR family NAD(P)-dependent oxidoreductase [Balneolales bacterium]
MQTSLVTGGAGFIGSHLCEKLIQQGHKVVCIDNFDDFYDRSIKERNLENLNGQAHFTLAEGDIRDADLLEQLFSAYQFDLVVHLAAKAGVRPSIMDPLQYQDVNIRGTQHILDSVKKHGVAKLLFASSSSVYGGNEKVPFAEPDEVNRPISPYAATKRAGELMCYTYHHLYNINVACLRFFTVYGPRQRPEMAIHKFTRLIHNGLELPAFGDGTSRRDYTYVDDIIQGITSIAGSDFTYDIINLGESQTIALKDLIATIGKKLDREPKIKWLPDQPGDVNITYADISRARNTYGYRPVTDVETGIGNFVDWYHSMVEAL